MKNLILIFLLIVFLLGCGVRGGPYDLEKIRIIQSNGIGYELFYIGEMPCVRISRTMFSKGVWAYDGVTCDWSKWEIIK